MKRIDKAVDKKALSAYVRAFPNPVRQRLSEDLRHLLDRRRAVERSWLFRIAPQSMRRKMLERAGAEQLESTRAAYNVFLGRIRSTPEYKHIYESIKAGLPIQLPSSQLSQQVNARTVRLEPPRKAATNVLPLPSRPPILQKEKPHGHTALRPQQGAKTGGALASGEGELPDFLRHDGKGVHEAGRETGRARILPP